MPKKFAIKIKDKKIELYNFLSFLKTQKDGDYIIEIKKKRQTKTIQQHKAVFLYCKWNAEDLVSNGITMNEFFKQGIELPFTTESFREYVWKKTQEVLFGTTSIGDLKKHGNIDKIVDVITKARAEKKLDYIPFPDKQIIFDKMQENDFKFDESK